MAYHRWTDEEIQALRDMPSSGESTDDVAKRFGLTIAQVESKLTRLYGENPDWWR